MNKTAKKVPLWILLAIVTTTPLFSFPYGPPPRLTGGFGEETCTRCHNSFPPDAGRALGGSFEITGVPREYEPAREYAIRVILGHPGQSRWGFELSSRFAGSGRQAGRLEPANSLAQVRRSGGVQFIHHNEEGTRRGEADGPVVFDLTWTAPEEPSSEPVIFNASGNAANGNDKPDGDYVYTAGAFSRGPDALIPVAQGEAPVISDAPPGRRTDDSRVSLLPAPRDLNRGNFEVLVQHRFEGPVSETGFLFGIDFGANINLGVSYAATDRLSVEISRARFFRNVLMGGTFELHTREESPWKMAVRGGVQAQDNFQRHYSGFIEVPTQFDYKAFRAYVVPTVIFNSRDDALTEIFRAAAVNPEDNHTFALGLGADVALNRKFSIVAEYIPRLYGFGGFGGERSATSGGVKIRTWGHVFHLLLSNSRVMTPAEYAVNSESNDIMFGFNIYRRIGR